MSDSNYFNPFPGLRSFEEEEEYLFFGRENQVDELLTKLEKSRFLAVVGASGSGKSSLVKSGLLPALHSGFLSRAGSGWRICTLKPGNNPIGNLSEALASEEILGEQQVSSSTSSIIESILRRSSDGISQTIKQLSDNKDQNILIVVDQFEELFRFSKYERSVSKGTRDAIVFINLLLDVASKLNDCIYIVFTMRADFLGDCAEFRGLPEAINEGQYLIPRMTREERKSAITGPVAVGGAQISQALLVRLLNDVGDNPDQLPILQHALMRTWDYWSKNSTPDSLIDLNHYEAIGTMTKALSLHAEEAFAEIKDEDGRIICEKLFRFLTEKRNDGRGVRHPGLVSDICELTGATTERITQIIDLFRKPGRSFLMPPYGVEIKEETIVDISHESLMRVWERLQTWVYEEIESAELYVRLGQSAELYQEGKTGLWRDPELMMAIHWKASQKPNAIWAKRYYPSFDRAMNYLDYSIAEKDRELKAEELKRRAALMRLRIFIFFISFACMGASYFAYKSMLNANAAIRNEEIAKIEKIKSDSLKKVATAERNFAVVAKDIANVAKDSANVAKLRAIQSAIEAKRQKDIADVSANNARLSAIAAQISKERAIASAALAERSRDTARDERQKAVANEKIAKEKTKEANVMRMLAEANNLAIKSKQIIKNPLKDNESLQLSFLAYGLNKFLKGPTNNRIIYDALKNQLTKSYLKSYQERKDKLTTRSKYDERTVVFVDKSSFYSAGDDGIVKHWKLEGNPIKIVEQGQTKKVRNKFNKLLLSPDKRMLIGVSVTGDLYLIDSRNRTKAPTRIQNIEGPSKFVAFLSNDNNSVDILVGYANSMVIYKINKSNFAIRTIESTKNQDFSNVRQFSTYKKGNDIGVFIAGNQMLSYLQIKKSNIGYNYSKPVRINLPKSFNESISSIGNSNTGKYVAIGGEKGALSLFEFNGSSYKHYRNIPGHISGITGIVFSGVDNHKTIITSAFDHSIHVNKLSDSKSEGLILKENAVWIRGLALSADNKNIIAIGQGGFITVWPSNVENLIASLNKVPFVNSTLNADLDTEQIKSVIGEDLYKSIENIDDQHQGFNKFWNFLIKSYLK